MAACMLRHKITTYYICGHMCSMVLPSTNYLYEYEFSMEVLFWLCTVWIVTRIIRVNSGGAQWSIACPRISRYHVKCIRSTSQVHMIVCAWLCVHSCAWSCVYDHVFTGVSDHNIMFTVHVNRCMWSRIRSSSSTIFC